MNFKKRVSGSWDDTPNYIHKTDTDTFTTLPAVLYPTGTTATVGLKGNTVQTGTPTPDNPIMPEGTGDLETVGTKAGQYKIPISSANTTTPIYLGEVETTRKIEKLVLTGGETIDKADNCFRIPLPLSSGSIPNVVSTHLPYKVGWELRSGATGICTSTTYYGSNYKYLLIRCDKIATTTADFKSYLQQQYAAGTPVTVWYVLATPTTGIVNEPIRKIGNYADEVSGISIPTIAGANTISVGTTLQPSEVTVNYKGWHPVQSVHERENGAWT